MNDTQRIDINMAGGGASEFFKSLRIDTFKEKAQEIRENGLPNFRSNFLEMWEAAAIEDVPPDMAALIECLNTDTSVKNCMKNSASDKSLDLLKIVFITLVGTLSPGFMIAALSFGGLEQLPNFFFMFITACASAARNKIDGIRHSRGILLTNSQKSVGLSDEGDEQTTDMLKLKDEMDGFDKDTPSARNRVGDWARRSRRSLLNVQEGRGKKLRRRKGRRKSRRKTKKKSRRKTKKALIKLK